MEHASDDSGNPRGDWARALVAVLWKCLPDAALVCDIAAEAFARAALHRQRGLIADGTLAYAVRCAEGVLTEAARAERVPAPARRSYGVKPLQLSPNSLHRFARTGREFPIPAEAMDAARALWDSAPTLERRARIQLSALVKRPTAPDRDNPPDD